VQTEGNSRLRAAIMAAKTETCPKTISTGNKERLRRTGRRFAYEELTYEGYGPEGCRPGRCNDRQQEEDRFRNTAHLSKYGGNLAENGSVSWIFEKKGSILVSKENIGEDELMEIALEAGAEDVRDEDHEFEVITDPASFEKVKKALEERELPYESASVTFVPKNTVKLGEDKATRCSS